MSRRRPADFQVFRSAKVALIPHASSGSSTLNVFVCSATNGAMVGAACSGPSAFAFTSVANQLIEIDISSSVSGKVGGNPPPYLAVLAYTTPTTSSDHFVALRFTHGHLVLPDINNVALGFRSLPPSAGSQNTALGSFSMLFGASGSSNTAVGYSSLFGNSILSGSGNTGVGAFALEQLATGSDNTAIGFSALREVHASSGNTAVGSSANFNGGTFNTAVGASALSGNNGMHNSALGYHAGSANDGERNTAVGAFALDSGAPFGGDDNIAIGYRAGVNVAGGVFDVFIGNEGAGGSESNTIRIGSIFNAGT